MPSNLANKHAETHGQTEILKHMHMSYDIGQLKHIIRSCPHHSLVTADYSCGLVVRILLKSESLHSITFKWEQIPSNKRDLFYINEIIRALLI